MTGIIVPLAMFTLLAVLLFGIWQLARTERARKTHETSNLTHPAAPAERKSTTP